MLNRLSIIGCFTVLGALAASLEPAWPLTKDQSRITDEEAGAAVGEAAPGEEGEGGADETVPPDVLPSDDIPAVETVELTVDAAKRALDAFAEVHNKYDDEGIENYDTLEEFVDRTEAGKRLETDIKAHGFADITEWNTTIMSVGFAYSAVVLDQEEDVRQQIEDVRADESLDEAARARLIASLSALLPSANNRKVVAELMDDPVYRDKLRLLEEEE